MANDLATGLGLGLKAASMAGAWDEAEQDRKLRKEMQDQQQTFTAGESQKGRDLKNKIYQGNNEVKRLEALRDQANLDNAYTQRDRHEDARVKRATEVLGYQRDMQIWQNRQANERTDKGIAARITAAKTAYERQQKSPKLNSFKQLDKIRDEFQGDYDNQKDELSKTFQNLQLMPNSLAKTKLLEMNTKALQKLEDGKKEWVKRYDRMEENIMGAKTTHSFKPGTKMAPHPSLPDKVIEVPDPTAPMTEIVTTNDPDEVERLRNLNRGTAYGIPVPPNP